MSPWLVCSVAVCCGTLGAPFVGVRKSRRNIVSAAILSENAKPARLPALRRRGGTVGGGPVSEALKVSHYGGNMCAFSSRRSRPKQCRSRRRGPGPHGRRPSRAARAVCRREGRAACRSRRRRHRGGRRQGVTHCPLRRTPGGAAGPERRRPGRPAGPERGRPDRPPGQPGRRPGDPVRQGAAERVPRTRRPRHLRHRRQAGEFTSPREKKITADDAWRRSLRRWTPRGTGSPTTCCPGSARH